MSGTVDGVTYTLPLAVFDLVPVVLSVLAYALVVTMIRGNRGATTAAALGVVLIAVGGLGKAVWKVVVAASDTDVTWLDDLLFPALSVGFLLLWGALAGRTRRGVVAATTLGGLAVGLALAVGYETAEVVLLAGMVVGSVGVTVHLIGRARTDGDRTAALLLAASLVVTFALAGLARAEQTAALQWVEEGSNALGQLLLLGAVIRLKTGQRDIPSERAVALTSTGTGR